MARPRRQVYPIDMYLAKIGDLDIRSDADVQRLAGQWSKSMINELVVTVLTNDYIPPIILGEEPNSQLWIIDGLQRSSSLRLYRYGNYKITSSIEDSIIPYKAKSKDEKGNIVWEDATFDIKNKTYEQLPDELKKRFNEYQIETVIHDDCDMKRISQLIKRYNNHTAMNAAQVAFTHLENFARDIRGIVDTDFFSRMGVYKENDITKGTLERIISEAVMCMFHLNDWKKTSTAICNYLNNNATTEEFETLRNNADRLSSVINDGTKTVFTTKDSFIFFTLFDKFTSLGIEDIKFAEFLEEFISKLKDKPVDGKLFYEVDKEKGKGTKDKHVIMDKLHILEILMLEFLHIDKEEVREIDEETFVSDIVGINKEDVHTDLECYKDTLKDLKNNTIRDGSKLLNEENNPSLLAMVAYSYKKDEDLDEWMTVFASKNNTYIADQRKNFYHMRDDFEEYLREKKGCLNENKLHKPHKWY